MQSQQPLGTLEPGQKISSFYVIRSLSEATKRDGEPYWRLQLQDKSGVVAGRAWDPANVGIKDPTVPGAYLVEGLAVEFRGELQINVDRVVDEPVDNDTLSELIPASAWEGDDLVASIRDHVDSQVKSEPLRRLLLAVIDSREFREEFSVRPAAMAMHHGYRSGLAEHTLSMMRIGTLIGRHYQGYYPGRVETDLIIAGALLHDFGKIWELSDGLASNYTLEGRLLGHIFMAAEWIAKKAEEVGGVPRELVVELQHLILSHHGKYEYGAPRVPKTVEAQILHYVDQIDAKTNQFILEEKGNDEAFYHRGLSRWVIPPTAWPRPWSENSGAEMPGEGGPGFPAHDPHNGESFLEPPPNSAPGGDEQESNRDNLSLFDGLDDEW
jgi:3'-5' exoribonuclease